MRVKCGCGNFADYAVYEKRDPHCLICMMEAVDTPIAIPVRTLDPWEQEIPEIKPEPTNYLFNRRNVQC